MKRSTEITCNIPGGWYGNDPGSMHDPKIGNVVVNPERALSAVAWLKRRATITATGISGNGDGFLIHYTMKY